MLTTNFHLTDKAAFTAEIVTPTTEAPHIRAPYPRIMVRDGAGNSVVIFPTHEQARELAAAILAALYPVTAAMAESEGAVQ